MRTTLRFFEEPSISKTGFLRGLVIFPMTTLGALLVFYLMGLDNYYFNSLFMGLMLCSVLGVQDNMFCDNTQDSEEKQVYVSMVYGIMAYLVIYFPLALIVPKGLITLPLSLLIGGINGVLLYYLGPSFN